MGQSAVELGLPLKQGLHLASTSGVVPPVSVRLSSGGCLLSSAKTSTTDLLISLPGQLSLGVLGDSLSLSGYQVRQSPRTLLSESNPKHSHKHFL